MNDIQRLALEICQNRTDLSDEKKERIRKMLLEPESIENMSMPSTSSSNNLYPVCAPRQMTIGETTLSNLSEEVEQCRLSRRFSKTRKIFGSDMCQNTGELKREKRWPSAATILASRKSQSTPKLRRQLSTIVASKIPNENLNGHVFISNANGNIERNFSESVFQGRRLTVPTENGITHNFVQNGQNLRLPKKLPYAGVNVFSPLKYKKKYTLHDVYRDLTIMRRAVSSCLTPKVLTDEIHNSNVNSVEISSEVPSDIILTKNDGEPKVENNAKVSNTTGKCQIHEKEGNEHQRSNQIVEYKLSEENSDKNVKKTQLLDTVDSKHIHFNDFANVKNDSLCKEPDEQVLSENTSECNDNEKILQFSEDAKESSLTDKISEQIKRRDEITSLEKTVKLNSTVKTLQRENGLKMSHSKTEDASKPNDDQPQNCDFYSEMKTSAYAHNYYEKSSENVEHGTDNSKRAEYADNVDNTHISCALENQNGNNQGSLKFVAIEDQMRKNCFDGNSTTDNNLTYRLKLTNISSIQDDTMLSANKGFKSNKDYTSNVSLQYDRINVTENPKRTLSMLYSKNLPYDNIYEDDQNAMPFGKETRSFEKGNANYSQKCSNNDLSLCDNTKKYETMENLDKLADYSSYRLDEDGKCIHDYDISTGNHVSSNIMTTNEKDKKCFKKSTDRELKVDIAPIKCKVLKKKNEKYQNGKTPNGTVGYIAYRTIVHDQKNAYIVEQPIKKKKSLEPRTISDLEWKQNDKIQHEYSLRKCNVKQNTDSRNNNGNQLKTKSKSLAKSREELYSYCRCHKHRGQDQNDTDHLRNRKVKALPKSRDIRNNVLSKQMCNVRNIPNVKFSQASTDNKLCTINNTILEGMYQIHQKNDSYNSFNTCFKTIISENTPSMTVSKNDIRVSKENDTLGQHGNGTRDRFCNYTSEFRKDRHTKMSLQNEGVKFVDNEPDKDIRNVNVEESKDDLQIPDVDDDSDSDAVESDDEVFRTEKQIDEGDDKLKPRKSVMLSGNSRRTDFTLSSTLSSRTPFSEYDYTEREIANDVISTILDDVIDLVWQANVSRFKHHVCKTNDLFGDETVGCIVLVDEGKQPSISFDCEIQKPASFPNTVETYEILIGNIVKIKVLGEHVVREGYVKVAVPFNKSNMRFFHEPVLRILNSKTNSWISIDSFENIYFDENDLDLSVLETNLSNDEESVYVVVARPAAEFITFDKNLQEYDSRIDSDVTVSSPVGSRVKTDSVTIKFTVLPISVDIVAETRDSSENDCQSLVGASPVVIIEQSYRNPQPLFICLPCERPSLNALKNRLSCAPCPQDSGIVTMSRLSKCAMHDFVDTWSETESHLIRIGGCERIKCELMTYNDVTEDNKVSFCIHEQKTTCLIVETRKEATRPSIKSIALNILKIIKYQRVVISVMQNKNMIQDLTVTCDLRSRYATRWRRRQEQDYDISSKNASLKEGDIISLNLRGNLTSIGKRFHIFRFHGAQGTRVNWNLQVVDNYSQRSLDFYYGFVQLLSLKTVPSSFEEVKTIDGHNWNVVLEIPVRLPKHQIGSLPLPIKTNLNVIEEGPVTLQFLSSIADGLAGQWIKVATALQITNARLQSLRRQNRNSDKQLVRDLLYTWFKNMPHAKEKASMLINLLQNCGKYDIADSLRQENEKYNTEKTKIATVHSVEKTLSTVIKSPHIIAKWKELATELGFSLEDINDFHNSGKTEGERCLNMLSRWINTGKQSWMRILARCVRRIGCKYVADHLLSTLVKQNQLTYDQIN
ncbi:unnamed protein product [Mytilus coruscus]|uniref:Death domain-containing protein n=1 Tax=Mytilus coruscus TaxID=42192 RepID=A0A6J8BFE9_MYTCO|nr:unnamed protein product [Mytilus coruscus]